MCVSSLLKSQVWGERMWKRKEDSPSAAAAETSQCATTQREAASTTITAQNGSIVNQQNFTDVHVEGNITTNISNTYVQAPARTDETTAPPNTKENIQRCQEELQSYLEKETENLFQGTKEDGSSTPMNKSYTKLYITEGGSGEVNSEHEVVVLECRRSTSEKEIQLNDILKALPNEDKPPQKVLTKGIAGIGKSVAVQKFTHDWAVREANQSIHFIFPFTFRDLNLIKHKPYSLVGLIAEYFEEVEDLEPSYLDSSSVLFIFDGLDESKLPLNFEKNEMCRSVTKTTTVDALLTNLISGKLLHKASVWITSRPAAASKIPPEFINRVTEVRGFNDEQKEEYFLKRISESDVARKICDHLQSKPLRTLYVMCHIPMFCWITATALQSLLTGTHEGELPKTVTEMYTHFLIFQTTRKNEKDYQEVETDKDRKKERDKEMIMKYGKLAFEQLQKGNIIFYEKDLKECKIDLKEAAVYSGVCTEIIRRESGLHREEVYSFIHLSVQEFLAALYVLETFIESGQNLLPNWLEDIIRSLIRQRPIFTLHKTAVDMALANDHGQWDLFLRFLLGLSQDKSQSLLHRMFGFELRSPVNNQDTITYIHRKIKDLSNTDKSINLFQCLNELGDQSLVEQVLKYQSSGDVSKISPAHWSALAFGVLLSNEDLDVFDLKKYCKSDEVLERLLPVLKASKTALLSDCNLTDRCCEYLSSALRSKSSGLEELDLSKNQLTDIGINCLSAGLKSPNCKLQRLRLCGCYLSETSCEALSSVLSSQSSSLRHLDLSDNELEDSGVKQLSAGLESPHCGLKTLRLCCCNLSETSCAALSSVLRSQSSSLRHLDLSKNNLKDSGVKQLSAGLESPHCGLKTLRLFRCYLSGRSCAALSSVLRSQSSSLTDLDLSNNDLKDSGAKQLSAGLESPHCGLKTLRLTDCKLSERSCAALSSVLSSQSSSLTDLDLSNNNLQDSGVKQLSAGLENPHCGLKTLRLCCCNLSETSCEALSSVLRSQSSSLTDLDLSNNKLKDSGAKQLSAGLESPHCGLKTLRLCFCYLSERSCEALSSVLSSQSSSLTDLDLSNNELEYSGVKQLSAGLGSPHCGLKTLRNPSLRSNPSHLRELDLRYNHPGDSGVNLFSAGLEDPSWRLDTLRLDHGGEQRMKPGVKKYFCELTVDKNTVNRNLKLSDSNRKVTHVTEKQPYPDHPERFDHWEQLLCKDVLTGRCYWEVKWRGDVDISVSYRGISRKGDRDDCMFGRNGQSWSLNCSDVDGYSVRHNKRGTPISSSSSVSNRVAVYVDCPAGTLSFYRVSSDTLIQLHTFNTTFTEPLYAGFKVWSGSVSLCRL